MAGYSICNQFSWMDKFQEQKLYFSMMSVCEQVCLCSGDGFSVSLPTHFLLAASKLARNTFLPNLNSQVVFLPSVRGSTLLLLVELLRSGKTSSFGRMDNMGVRLQEVQDVMELLRIPGCTALMRVQDFVEKSESSKEETNNDPTYLTPVEVLMSVGSPTPVVVEPNAQVSKDLLVDSSLDVTEEPNCQNNAEVVDNLFEEILSDSESMFMDKNDDLKGSMKMNMSKACAGDQIGCEFCEASYNTRISLLKHMKKCHKDKMYPCEDCGRFFITENILLRHVVSHINQSRTETQVSCEHCQKKDIPRDHLHRHMKKYHSDLMFRCGVCEKHFVLEKSLYSHMKSAHGGNRFQCEECPKNFATKSVLKVHVKNSHNAIGLMFACPQCPSLFRYDHNLNRHVRKFHEKKV